METDFFLKTGKMALVSKLRMLASKITEDAAKIYELYDIQLQPKWFPVFHVLSEGNGKTITEIAAEIGHSQPSVSKIIKEMSKADLVKEKKDANDRRRNVITLSVSGNEIVYKMKHQNADVEKAIEAVLAQTKNNLWQAIEEWEFMLAQKSLLERVKDQRKERESGNITIVNYEPKYQSAFKQLNEEWISKYFKLEEADYKALDHPKKYILDNGGCILIALYHDEPVGVCALIKMDDPEYDFELAKMAVSPKVQGKNIGWLLGQAIVHKAQELGASTLYLESNTILKPAMSLYHKLGFQKVAGRSTPYERCNIQMELKLK